MCLHQGKGNIVLVVKINVLQKHSAGGICFFLSFFLDKHCTGVERLNIMNSPQFFSICFSVTKKPYHLWLLIEIHLQYSPCLDFNRIISNTRSGAGGATNTDDVRGKFQTAFDPTSVSETYIAIFSENPC